jgi:cell division protein FtsI/penicillin-binding protein 2
VVTKVGEDDAATYKISSVKYYRWDGSAETDVVTATTDDAIVAAHAEITNKYSKITGGVEVTKTVVSPVEEDLTKKFDFTIEITLPETDMPSGETVTYNGTEFTKVEGEENIFSATFKLANGLIALQDHIITTSSVYNCSGGGYHIGSHVVHCHNCGGLNIYSAIQRSCNTFFCRAYYNILSNRVKYKNIDEAYTAWLDYMSSMGFLQVFNTDLPYELQGRIPTAEYFDKKYNNSWNGNTVVSMGIGQGEAAVTPLQMANMLAVIANKGYYIRPHVVRPSARKTG